MKFMVFIDSHVSLGGITVILATAHKVHGVNVYSMRNRYHLLLAK